MEGHADVAHRKWFQFNLRTLFLILLLSGPIIYWGPHLYEKLFPVESELPSAYYYDKDIQYFPAGPEFKLTKEAKELKNAYNAVSEKPLEDR